ncbi:cytochrome c3 family protein [Selenomonas ruminantium]|uniref:cytochrome c3 family protein n=1 Tax=Selenomonas ruminantium TaxID=971 RepID=UPI0026EEFD49|nr:cytochrome c3 family protein [Selenomonas ruminantium]
MEGYNQGELLSNKHKAAHVDCIDCHENGIEDKVKETIWYVTDDFGDPPAKRHFDNKMCTKCHSDMDALVAKTDKGSGVNPHNSHLGDLTCSDCHKMHNQSKAACQNCHSKWPTEAPAMHQTACKSLKSIYHDSKRLQKLIDDGVVKSADSLKELARQMNLPYEKVKAEVERYNEMARKGFDDDFYKRKECLTTIEKPPFYAAHISIALLVTLGGLKSAAQISKAS